MTLRDDYVRKLEAEVDELHERVAVLEEQIGARLEAPLALGLTGQESRVFGALMSRELVTKEMMLAVLYLSRGRDEAEQKIIDVFICKMRPKLKLFGIAIETVWGRGYLLKPEMKRRVRELFPQFGAVAA